MTDCTLCAELSTGVPPAVVACDGQRIAWLDSEWSLAPSLGPVSPVHILLIPRAHRQFSLTVVDALRLIEALADAMQQETAEDRKVVLFEHANSPSGCGVLHAHVHAVTVPCGFDVRGIFGKAVPRRFDSLSAFGGELSELSWCFDGAGSIWAAVDAQIASQAGRRAVGAANAVPFDTDWKAYTHRPWFESSHLYARTLATVLRRSSWPARPAA